MEHIDEWDFPFVLDSYVRRSRWTIGMDDTRLFISQRIIPQDRQNIGMVLKDNGLENYDEAKLFVLSDGRCAQDECYIKQISEEEVDESVKRRRERRLLSLYRTTDHQYLISFVSGKTALLDVYQLKEQDAFARRMLAYYDLFREAMTRCAGAEITFGNGMGLTYDTVYHYATELPFTVEQLCAFSNATIMSTQEITEQLNCSRQNIHDSVKRGRITPLDTNTKEQFFLKSEVYKLM